MGTPLQGWSQAGQVFTHYPAHHLKKMMLTALKPKTGWTVPANHISIDSLMTKDTGWNDVNLSSVVPKGVKAVIIEARNGGVNGQCNFRPNGSSEARVGWVPGGNIRHFIVPVDANRVIENHTPVAATACEIVAYSYDATFLTVSASNACASINTYTDMDLSAAIPANITAAWFEINYAGGNANAVRWAMRPNGSSYDSYVGTGATATAISMMAFSGLDANRVFELEVGSLVNVAYLWGYDAHATPTTVVAKTPSKTNEWVDVDCSVEIPAGAVGVILNVVPPVDVAGVTCSLRKKGSTDDIKTNISLGVSGGNYHWVVGLDANRVFQVYSDHTTTSLKILGYLTGS